jgi:hypothetical protein
MIPKHQKLIAILVTIAFLSLLQASAMPLRAEPSSNSKETSVESSEQTPGFIEQVGYSHTSRKKSILPIILVGIGVAAIAAFIVLVVFKSINDITGAWIINLEWEGGVSGQTELQFIGKKKSGDVYLILKKVGTYTVDGKKVSWTVEGKDITTTFKGEFVEIGYMKGTMTNTNSASGTWYAILQDSTTSKVPGNPQVVLGIPSSSGK